MTKTEFESRVEKIPIAGCWLWTGAVSGGYGSVKINRRTFKASRISYSMYNGFLYGDEQVLHKCDVKLCVNPEHLYMGSHSDNMKDACNRNLMVNRNSEKTHCKNGHEFTLDNTYVYPSGARECKICRRARDAIRRG